MAVINIGSGSVKLFLGSTGMTEARVTLFAGNNKEATEETFSAVAHFFCKARAAGESVAIFGTEAMRTSDGTLKARIEKELGVPVDIIDGQTEALCGFLGAAAGITNRAIDYNSNTTRTVTQAESKPKSNSFFGKPLVVIDVGGASTELSCGVDYPDFCCSLPMGSVALFNIFGEAETRDSAFLPKIYAHIDNILLSANYDFGEDNIATLIGGSGKYLARLFAAQGTSANAHTDKCAGEIVTEKIPDIIKELFALSPAQRTKRYPFIEEKRALVLPYGLCIVYRVLKMLRSPIAVTSKSGLIEGYIKLRGL